MNKLTLAFVAGCMSVAVAGAHAATGSPADTDKAGRMGPGTAAGQMGAVEPGKVGGSGAARSTSTGAATSSTAGAGAGASTGTTTEGTTTRSNRRARASRG